MKRYNFYISEGQLSALHKLAQDGISVSEHIRRAVDEYIERNIDDATKSPSKPKNKPKTNTD